MLGAHVLVAPVVTQGPTSRAVYFPKGCWQDPQIGLTETGPVIGTMQVPLTQLAYFFTCGTNPFKPKPSHSRSRRR